MSVENKCVEGRENLKLCSGPEDSKIHSTRSYAPLSDSLHERLMQRPEIILRSFEEECWAHRAVHLLTSSLLWRSILLSEQMNRGLLGQWSLLEVSASVYTSVGSDDVGLTARCIRVADHLTQSELVIEMGSTVCHILQNVTNQSHCRWRTGFGHTNSPF